MRYDSSIPAHRGFMQLLEVICSVGAVNSRAHGRLLLGLVPGYEQVMMRLVQTDKQKVIDILTAVVQARYFGSGQVYEAGPEDFPPALHKQLATAAVAVKPVVKLQEAKITLPTFAILPNGLVITVNEPTAQETINPWPAP